MKSLPGQVFVFSRGKNIPREVADAIHGGLQIRHINNPANWPRPCHLYVTKAAITAGVARAAGAMTGVTIPVTLPEQHDWLAAMVIILAGQGDVYLFHAARAGERL